MSAPLRVVAVVGTTRSVSKTKALAELIIGRLAAHAEIAAEVIEIHALNPWSRHRRRARAAPARRGAGAAGRQLTVEADGGRS
jgi:NAD(P)H-dependent FMN reductase